MSNETNVVRVEEKQIQAQHAQPQAGISPLVQMAMSGNVNTEQLRELMAIQKEWQADEARKAFHEALAAAKAEMPVAKKTGKNDHLKSTYATLDDYLAVANPVLARYGLSVSWTTGQADGSVSAVCRITHQRGHTESTDPVAMPIASINKAVNPAQEVGIAMTYAKRYSFCNAMGMATEDADGGSPPKSAEPPPAKTYTPEQFKTQMKGWVAKVESGDVTANRVIAQVSNHIQLTEAQHEEIATLREYTPATSK